MFLFFVDCFLLVIASSASDKDVLVFLEEP